MHSEGLVAFLYLMVALFQESGLIIPPAIEVTVNSDIPIGAGLGSSAAFSVASAAALIQLLLGLQRNRPAKCDLKTVQDRICQWSFKSEKIIHGTPSGKLFGISKWAFSSVKALWAQSFTSLMQDLRQDINRVSSFSRCFSGTFP